METEYTVLGIVVHSKDLDKLRSFLFSGNQNVVKVYGIQEIGDLVKKPDEPKGE